MDFSKYELSDELRAALIKDYDADVAGLKAKNAELIEREKTSKADVEKLTLEAATVEENNKIALAEKEGTVEQYKVALAEKEEKIKTINFEFQEANNKRLLDSSVNEFSNLLSDDPAG